MIKKTRLRIVSKVGDWIKLRLNLYCGWWLSELMKIKLEILSRKVLQGFQLTLCML